MEKTYTEKVGAVGVPRNWVSQSKRRITISKIVCVNSGEERIIVDDDRITQELAIELLKGGK
jgi:hypothetical protein